MGCSIHSLLPGLKDFAFEVSMFALKNEPSRFATLSPRVAAAKLAKMRLSRAPGFKLVAGLSALVLKFCLALASMPPRAPQARLAHFSSISLTIAKRTAAETLSPFLSAHFFRRFKSAAERRSLIVTSFMGNSVPTKGARCQGKGYPSPGSSGGSTTRGGRR